MKDMILMKDVPTFCCSHGGSQFRTLNFPEFDFILQFFAGYKLISNNTLFFDAKYCVVVLKE